MVTDGENCNALKARIDALEKMLDEREERTKERFSTMKAAVDDALRASDKAVNKAEAATEKRFDGVNEFRETLRDQAATLMPRIEYEVQYKSINEMVGSLQARVNTLETLKVGRSEGLGVVGQITLGVFSFIIAAAAVTAVLIAIFHH